MNFKIPFYEIVNMFLTGVVFIVYISLAFPNFAAVLMAELVWVGVVEIPDFVVTVFWLSICYEIGLIINRIGSVLLEPLAVKFRLIAYNKDYESFNKAKMSFPILEVLSRQYAVSRTGVMLFSILAALSCLRDDKALVCYCFGFVVVFLFSWKKSAIKIVSLVAAREAALVR